MFVMPHVILTNVKMFKETFELKLFITTKPNFILFTSNGIFCLQLNHVQEKIDAQTKSKKSKKPRSKKSVTSDSSNNINEDSSSAL